MGYLYLFLPFFIDQNSGPARYVLQRNNAYLAVDSAASPPIPQGGPNNDHRYNPGGRDPTSLPGAGGASAAGVVEFECTTFVPRTSDPVT